MPKACNICAIATAGIRGEITSVQKCPKYDVTMLQAVIARDQSGMVPEELRILPIPLLINADVPMLRSICANVVHMYHLHNYCMYDSRAHLNEI